MERVQCKNCLFFQDETPRVYRFSSYQEQDDFQGKCNLKHLDFWASEWWFCHNYEESFEAIMRNIIKEEDKNGKNGKM